MNPRKNPAWWLLYLIIAILFGLLWYEWNAPLTNFDHHLAEITILIFMFGSVSKWLKWNEIALMNQDRSNYRHHWSRPDSTPEGKEHKR